MTKENKPGTGSNEGKTKATFLFKLGVVLIALSFLKWAVLLYMPFLHYSGKVKVSLVSVILVLAEITFWVGIFLVGEETYKRYKKYFNPKNWFKKAVKEILEEEKKEHNKEKSEKKEKRIHRKR